MKKAAVMLLGALVLASGIARAAPNDPFFSAQWGLEIVNAAAAWTKSEGKGVVVAVVDTGVDPTHPDLRARLLPGRDFVDEDDDPRDENGHGTMIAGIIAASTGNGVGVASVAPRARLLPVRVLGADGTGDSNDVASGIEWAIEQGADVINLSLAQEGNGGGGLLPSDLLRTQSVDQAIRDAARAGATVVVAAGNNRSGGTNETAYDADVAGVAVVGASTRADKRAAYSNHGSGLDLLAPGGGSATNPAESGCTQDNSVVSTWWDRSDGGSKYAGGCGTSMSVAFVSGVAALLHARGMSNAKVVDRILETAQDLGAPNRDDQTGHGRLDAAAALRVTSTPTPAPKPKASPAKTLSPEPTPPVVEAQGDQDPLPTPDPTDEPPTSTPTTEARDVPSRPPVAFPGGPAPAQNPAWPVTFASALISIMVLAHTVRFLHEPRAD